jgi:hypothetical protein
VKVNAENYSVCLYIGTRLQGKHNMKAGDKSFENVVKLKYLGTEITQ